MGSPQTFDSARLRGKENNAPQEQDLFTFSAKLDKTARIVFARGFFDKGHLIRRQCQIRVRFESRVKTKFLEPLNQILKLKF